MKKMKSFLVLGAFALIFSQAQAATHTILVGQGSTLTFSPNTLTTVVVGDVIRWEWVTGSHTTTSVSVPGGADTWTNAINSTSTFFEYTVAVAGTYTYKCNPHFGAGMQGDFQVSTATDVMMGLVYNSLVIAPNPAAESITVSFRSDRSFTATVMIFDQKGSLKKEEKVKVKSGDNSFSCAISRWPEGHYILNVLDGEKAIVAQKFIKE